MPPTSVDGHKQQKQTPNTKNQSFSDISLNTFKVPNAPNEKKRKPTSPNNGRTVRPNKAKKTDDISKTLESTISEELESSFVQKGENKTIIVKEKVYVRDAAVQCGQRTIATQTGPEKERDMIIFGEKNIADLIKTIVMHTSISKDNKPQFSVKHIATKITKLTGISTESEWVRRFFN